MAPPPPVAMHAVTVTCPVCGEPITCPVVLTAGAPVRSPVDGKLIMPVNVRTDTGPLTEHRCPDDYEPWRQAA